MTKRPPTTEAHNCIYCSQLLSPFRSISPWNSTEQHLWILGAPLSVERQNRMRSWPTLSSCCSIRSHVPLPLCHSSPSFNADALRPRHVLASMVFLFTSFSCSWTGCLKPALGPDSTPYLISLPVNVLAVGWLPSVCTCMASVDRHGTARTIAQWVNCSLHKHLWFPTIYVTTQTYCYITLILALGETDRKTQVRFAGQLAETIGELYG